MNDKFLKRGSVEKVDPSKATRAYRWQLRKRALGLCIDCGKQIESGRTRCPKHLEQKRRIAKAFYQRHHAALAPSYTRGSKYSYPVPITL